MNYRDKAPEYYKELTSDGIMSFFEDERATFEELEWFKNVINSPEYQAKKNPISKYKWHKIKNDFAKKFFPDIAPAEKVESKMTMEQRMNALFS